MCPGRHRNGESHSGTGALNCVPSFPSKKARTTRSGPFCSYSGRLSAPVEHTVKPIPFPAPPPGAAIPAHRHIAAWRELHRQFRPHARPHQSQLVPSRCKAGKNRFFAAQQHPRPAKAPPAGTQDHTVQRTSVLYQNPDAAAVIPRLQAQRRIHLFALLQAESFAGVYSAAYCSSFALTRYSPAPTPPNIYLPAALVLVTETSCSRVTPASVTTR